MAAYIPVTIGGRPHALREENIIAFGVMIREEVDEDWEPAPDVPEEFQRPSTHEVEQFVVTLSTGMQVPVDQSYEEFLELARFHKV